MLKSKIVSLIAVVLVVATVLSVSAYNRNQVSFVLPDSSELDIYSCRFTKTEPESPKTPNLLKELSDFELKMENDYLAVYFREETSGIRILNKSNGYVWGGLKQDKPDNMNKSWSMMANSVLTIDYIDEDAQSSRISLGKDTVNKEFDWQKESCTCRAEFTEAGISLEFTISIEDDKLSVELNRDSIEETDIYTLQSVWILPFLGSVEQNEIDGYFFIPDGSGALVRFSKNAQYVSPYDERIYGKDAAVDQLTSAGDLLAKRNNDYMTDISNITVPVYGVVHGAGKSAFLAEVESGAEYASIYMSPAGLVTDYNWLSARFDWRRAYTKPLNNSGANIFTVEENLSPFNAKVTYKFLSGEEASYTGMALSYREKLISDGILNSAEKNDKDIPVLLDVMAADVKKTIWGNKHITLTDTNKLKSITEKLYKDKITNLAVNYIGWQKGGLNGADFYETKFDNDLGSISDIEKLKDKITSNGGRFYLSVNPITFNGDQARLQSATALTNSNKYAVKTRNNKELIYPNEYFSKISLINDKFSKLLKKTESFTLSLEKIGNTIYSDYSRNAEYSRSKTLQTFENLLKNSNQKPMLDNPNNYLWKYAGEVSELPMQNSQYLFESDSVPFLPILLKGSLDYYAPYTNQGFYTDSCILKMIEYGAYPSFVIMGEENEALIDTPLSDYFSLCFDDWNSLIIEVYNKINPALTAVEGSKISNHEMLADGIAKVSYDNGVKIYINYTADNFELQNGKVVDAHNFLVERG